MKLYTLAALCFAPAAIYAVAASPSRPYIVRVSGAPSPSPMEPLFPTGEQHFMNDLQAKVDGNGKPAVIPSVPQGCQRIYSKLAADHDQFIDSCPDAKPPTMHVYDRPHKASNGATLPELMPKATRADLEGTLMGLCGEVMNIPADDFDGEISCAQQQVKLYQEVEKEVEQELKQDKKEKNL